MLPKQVQYVTHSEYLNQLFKKSTSRKMLDVKDIQKLLPLLESGMLPAMLLPLKEWLEGELSHVDTAEKKMFINCESFITYLSLLLCDKISNSPIAVGENGKINIFYNHDSNKYFSNKITLEINEKRIIFSILNRENSLAIMTGELKLSLQSLYKIENFMNIDLA